MCMIGNVYVSLQNLVLLKSREERKVGRKEERKEEEKKRKEKRKENKWRKEDRVAFLQTVAR